MEDNNESTASALMNRGGGPIGSPKTLIEAIENGLSNRTEGTSIEADIYYNVRDFLAQKMNTAYFNCKTEGELERLRDLWNMMVDRPADHGIPSAKYIRQLSDDAKSNLHKAQDEGE